MKNKKNTHNFSKALLIFWTVLLFCIVLVLVWTSMSKMIAKDPEKKATIDIKLTESEMSKLDHHVLKDNNIKTEGNTASAENIPSEIVPTPPYQAYAAQQNPDIEGKIKIAFIFTALGVNDYALNQIMEGTPTEVSFSFLPFSHKLKESMNKARTQGREVLLDVPMEPNSYPQTDPGPHTLLTGLPEKDNLERLNLILSQGQEYVGLVNFRGSLFLSSPQSLTPILEEIDARGLAFVEATTNYRSKADHIASEMKMPYLRSHFMIDEALTLPQLKSLLIQIEQMSKKVPVTVVIARTSPRTVPFLISWIQRAKDGKFAFIPVSQALQILSRDRVTPKPTYEKSHEMATKT